MKPFINCKYESVYNVLKIFNKNTTILNNMYHFELEEENDILVAYPKSKLEFSKVFKIFRIREVTVDKTNDIKQFLIENLSRYKCIVIKTDLYYQSFSEKYYCKKHKKHNVFIKCVCNNTVKIVENEFADSEKYIEMDIELDELEKWYYGYLTNYYDTNVDNADTIFLYEQSNETHLKVEDYYKLLDFTYDLRMEKINLSKFENYIENSYEMKAELKTYTNILNYKLKSLNRKKDYISLNLENILVSEINILHKLQKDVYRNNSTQNNRKKLVELWNKEIKYLTEINPKNNIILRKRDKYKVLNDISDMQKFNKYVDNLYVQEGNVIFDIQNISEEFYDIRNIKLKELSKMISPKYKEYNNLLGLEKDNLINSLKIENYMTQYINIQRNSINGYAKTEKKEKYFFKILKNDSALQEIRGYFCLIGRFNVSKIKEIIKYKNYSIIIFFYDETIQKNIGLLNDFFVENDNKINIREKCYKTIKNIIEENLKFAQDSVWRKNFPMQTFFNERVPSRLKMWYTEDLRIKYDNKEYSLLKIINDVEEYFLRKRLYKSFLSQGDPNALNIGVKPIMFDYATSGYNPFVAEFCTMMWSILFNDLYFAPKYHANSYYNHEKILCDYKNYKTNLNYCIDKNTISIIEGKIRTTRVRKEFMLEYIRKIQKFNSDIINQECIYFIIMRILCVFNLNEMEEEDKVYAIFIMITFINITSDCKNCRTLDAIERFIVDLEVF